MRVLIIGGYGAFGARAAERLARESDLEIVVAGRSRTRAEAAAAALRRGAKTSIGSAVLDATRTTAADLGALAPSVVINASGPYQARDYALAKACIAARCHYVDLADARSFVTGVMARDREAKAAGVLVASGASSVPGLSSAVVASFAGGFGRLERLDIAISPGSSFDPGAATAASVLGGAGKAIPMLLDGETRMVYGWQGLGRAVFPELGRRWTGYVEVPDLDLFPARYPSLRTVRFQAGLEVGLVHLGLWGLSWLVRAGAIGRPDRFAAPLLAVKRHLSFLGSDRGGMFVVLEGEDRQGQPKRVDWHLVAGSGHGAYVPAIPSVILAKRLARGTERRTGAMACMGLFTVVEFLAEVADLDISCSATISDPQSQTPNC